MAKKLWSKDYILLLQSSVISTIGDLMYSVAIGYWMYTETQSSSLMGVMSAISMFVTMFLSPFSGSVVDKLNRKWVLIIGDLFQGGIMLTIGALAYLDRLTIPGVLIAAFLAALGGVFYSPASSTLMIDIIPKDDMVRGQSIFSGCNSLVNMIGSSLSGVMVAFLGVPLIVIINGLSNIYAATLELFVHAPKTVQQGEAVSVGGILKDTKAAVQVIFSEPCLRIFVLFALILNLLAAGAFSLILPFTVEKGFSIEQYGYLMSAWTASSLLAVMFLGTIKVSPNLRFWFLAIGFVASEIFLFVGYLRESFVVLCIFACLGAFCNTIGNSIFNASLMLALPEKNRCAILGFISSASVGGTALSSLIYGFLGDFFPLYIVFAAGSAISLVPMLYLCFNRKTKEFILTH